MTRDDKDLVYSHFPILFLVVKILNWFGYTQFEGAIGCLCFAVIGIGGFAGMGYCLVRVIRLNWPGGKTTGWFIGCLCLPFIFCPLLYWLHLSKINAALSANQSA